MKMKKTESALRPRQKWYADGLRFKCTACGHCCRWGKGYVWVNEREIHAMAEHLGTDVLEFGRKYLRRVGGCYSLVELPDYRCVFLDAGERCRVYPVRPMQCRTFPFWPEWIRSPAAWQALADDCPGLDRGRLSAADEVEALARETEEGLL